MTTFSDSDKQRIWRYYDLPREELISGSSLSVALQLVEQFDTLHNTTLVKQVQGYLADLDELSETIRTVQGSTTYDMQIVDVDGEYRTNRGLNGSPVTGYLERRNEILNKISQILQFYPMGQQGRLMRG